MKFEHPRRCNDCQKMRLCAVVATVGSQRVLMFQCEQCVTENGLLTDARVKDSERATVQLDRSK